MIISRSLVNLCIKALTESMDTGTMVHLAREFFPNYNLHDRTGFASSLAIPNVDAARQIVSDVFAEHLGLEFVVLLVKVQDSGWKGHQINIKQLPLILKGIYNQGYLYDKKSNSFMENPRIRKTRNWGILKENREYNFTFLRLDVVNSSKMVKKYPAEKISIVYDVLRAIVQKSVEERNGRIWSWEGDGGLASFFYGNKDSCATLAAMDILHEIFLYNRISSPLPQAIVLRIAVHSGKCPYLLQEEELKKNETIKKIMEIEKDHTAAGHLTISVVVKEMLDSIVAESFCPAPGNNALYDYSLEPGK